MQLSLMSQNVQYGAGTDGRWEKLAAHIRQVGPALLLLQEVDWLSDPDRQRQAEADLGMRIEVAPSRRLPTALAWDEQLLRLVGCETTYSVSDMHHGYCAARFAIDGVEVPLVAISTHLTPYSAQGAALEAQMLIARVYRHGGLGLIGGDINHPPLPVPGEPEPDWEQMQPYNRSSRCLPRQSEDEPWQADTIVGSRLRDGGLTDVGAKVAQDREDLSLLAPTGKAGLLRVDQIHVTPALAPTVTDYRRVDPGESSDHYGVVATLDLSKIDKSRLRTYT